MTSAFVVVAFLVPSISAGQQAPGARVVILSPSEEDARIRLVFDAIGFWARAFVDLGLEPALADADVILSTATTRALENYARRVSQSAGRLTPGSFAPDRPPRELTDIDGDVVVLLSTQKLMQFAWPLPQTPRFFVAISAAGDDVSIDTDVIRNVIAHELGHVVGLPHRDEPAALMCFPCRTEGRTPDQAAFRPLMPEDRSRLIELYSAAQTPTSPGERAFGPSLSSRRDEMLGSPR